MASEQPDRGLQLVDVTDEGVRSALMKLDEMSDAELRELVRGEPALFVEAAEGIIARRHSSVPITSTPWRPSASACRRRQSARRPHMGGRLPVGG